MAFVPTAQHLPIFDWIDRHLYDGAKTRKEIAALVISARAGTGKTTTLRKIAERIPQRPNPFSDTGAMSDILYLAFNKSAVEDVQARGLAPHVEAKTLNSLGFAALRRWNRNIDLDAAKTERILESRLTEDDAKKFTVVVKKLVSLAKSQGLAPAVDGVVGAVLPDNPDSWSQLIHHYDVEAPFDDDSLMPRAVEIARKTLVASMKSTVMDFDDQLWVPLMLGLPMRRRYRYVFVDEAQDLNPVQRRLVRSAVEPGGVIIAVGDPYQCCYGFRGADVASFDRFEDEYGATIMPLSVTWRCPSSVVELAKRLVPDYEAAPEAPVGTVINATVSAVTDWSPGDLIVCRLNAPLVKLAHRFLRQRIPCRIAGRDFARGLTSLIKKLKPTSLEDLIRKANAYLMKKRDKLSAAKKEAQIQALTDKVETIVALAEEVDDMASLHSTIETMFSDVDSKGLITLSSIHRAKGQEAKRVFLLSPHLLPFKGAKLAWEIEQERNLEYIALTRAEDTLVFLVDDTKKNAKKSPTQPTEPMAASRRLFE